jgi:hypothetical protein
MIIEGAAIGAPLLGRGRRTLRSPSDCWRIRPDAFEAAARSVGYSASDVVKCPNGTSNAAQPINGRMTTRRIETPF